MKGEKVDIDMSPLRPGGRGGDRPAAASGANGDGGVVATIRSAKTSRRTTSFVGLKFSGRASLCCGIRPFRWRSRSTAIQIFRRKSAVCSSLNGSIPNYLGSHSSLVNLM